MNERNANENQGLSREALLSEYLKPDSVIKISTIASLLFGGIIFLVYFTYIGFMPEMDLQSSLVLLATGAIMGGICLLGLCFCLVLPGMNWSYNILDDKNLKDILPEDEEELRRWFFEPFIFLLLLLIIFLLINKYIINSYLDLVFLLSIVSSLIVYRINLVKGKTLEKRKKFNDLRGYLRRIIRNVRIKFSVLATQRKNPAFNSKSRLFRHHINEDHEDGSKNIEDQSREKCSSKKTENSDQKLISKALILCLFDLLSYAGLIITWLVLYVILLGKQSFNESTSSFFISIVVIGLVSCITNYLILALPKTIKSVLQSLGIGFVASVLLLMLFNSATTIPEAIMRTYGWGGMYQASIIVDNKGCDSLQKRGAKIDQPCSDESSLYKFDNIDILSTIGKEWYLKLHAKDSKPFALPRNTIISFSKTTTN